MKARKENTTKVSETAKVDEYMQGFEHPLKEVVEALRKLILATDMQIGEEIKWNAPAFFYTGEMEPFNPKEYKRHFIVFNLFKKDFIRLVFPSGAKVNDISGLLEGDYTDGRRLATFHNLEEVQAKTATLQTIIRQWLASI